MIRNYKHYFTETWKDIPEYKGLYQASNLGNIKSLNYKKSGEEQLLKQGKKDNGYLIVHLCKNGKMKTCYVHRLIWEAFNGPIPEGLQCNHINEKKFQNNLENLNLMTCKENINWGSGTERCHLKERNEKAAKANRNGKCSKTVLQFDLNNNLIKEWPSISEIKRQLGYLKGNISSCCLGKHKTAYGFVWKYKNNEVAA